MLGKTALCTILHRAVKRPGKEIKTDKFSAANEMFADIQSERCDERVCLSVCLSACISQKPHV